MSPTRGLEREVERLKETLRQSIATVRQHITLSNPHSPAALLAADPAVYSAILGLDGGNNFADLSHTLSNTTDASNALFSHGENGTIFGNSSAMKCTKGGSSVPSAVGDASSMTFVDQPGMVMGKRTSALAATTQKEETLSPSSATNYSAPEVVNTVVAMSPKYQESAVVMPSTAGGLIQSRGNDIPVALEQQEESMARALAGGAPGPQGGQHAGGAVLEGFVEGDEAKLVVPASLDDG